VLWAAISPLALGFAAQREATASMFAAGIAVVVLGSWTLVATRGVLRNPPRARRR
jgi:hypothetical protein